MNAYDVFNFQFVTPLITARYVSFWCQCQTHTRFEKCNQICNCTSELVNGTQQTLMETNALVVERY